MSRVAVYDACVLFPATLRDLMLRLAAADLVQPRWSDRILDECFRNILLKRPELSVEALARTRMKMCAAFPDAMVADDVPVGSVFGLPDTGRCPCGRGGDPGRRGVHRHVQPS